MKTVRICVLLGEKQIEFLKKRADEKGLNVSILLRQLVEKSMEETRETERPKAVTQSTGRYFRKQEQKQESR